MNPKPHLYSTTSLVVGITIISPTTTTTTTATTAAALYSLIYCSHLDLLNPGIGSKKPLVHAMSMKPPCPGYLHKLEAQDTKGMENFQHETCWESNRSMLVAIALLTLLQMFLKVSAENSCSNNKFLHF